MSSVQIVVSLCLLTFLAITGCNDVNQAMTQNRGISTAKQNQTLDHIPPSLAITSPSLNGTFTSAEKTIELRGTVSDNTGVTELNWKTDQQTGGMIGVSPEWVASNIELRPGENIITVTAIDEANNISEQKLVVTLQQGEIDNSANQETTDVNDDSKTSELKTQQDVETISSTLQQVAKADDKKVNTKDTENTEQVEQPR